MPPQLADFINMEEDSKQKGMSPSSLSTRENPTALDYQESPGTFHVPKHIVVVMDGLREFSWEPLEWVLKNVADGASSSCTVTLLGVTPWLNIPLSSKIWSDIWSIDLDDLSSMKGWRNDAKYHKVRALLDICQHYGVVLEIRTEMGHPLHLLVIEQISSLHASLVVFDRHHDRKFIEFYAQRIPCNMVKMKEDGQVDTIQTRRVHSADTTPQNDAFFNVNVAPSTSRSAIFSDKIKKLLKRKYARDVQCKDDHHQQHRRSDGDGSLNSCGLSNSKSSVLPGQIKKLIKRKYGSFGKKNPETAPFGRCLNGF